MSDNSEKLEKTVESFRVFQQIFLNFAEFFNLFYQIPKLSIIFHGFSEIDSIFHQIFQSFWVSTVYSRIFQ